MRFHFLPMTSEYAGRILTWKYPPPYDLYDYDKAAEHILDSAGWGKTLFAALDETGALAGELTLGFLDRAGEWVSLEDMQAGRLDGCILWVGFGLRPGLTGHGLGLSFVNACTGFAAQFARKQYGYQGRYIGLGVYQFNQRAIKVYERAGFVKFMERTAIVNGQELPAQRMKKPIETPAQLSNPPEAGKSFQILAAVWLPSALLMSAASAVFLQGAFPLFTFAMLLALLAVFAQKRNPAAIGLRPLPLKTLARWAALCLAGSLFLTALVEPWSHTYRILLTEAVSSSRPDAMFGWLVRFPGLGGWAGFILYGAFAALFAEEAFFRGWLLTLLKGRMSARKAVLWQAALFTLPQLLAAFLLPPLQGVLYAGVYSWLAIGVVNGWAACRTNSIWPGLVSAVLYNIILTACSL